MIDARAIDAAVRRRHFSAQACANLSAAAREREARAGMLDREPGQRELFHERVRRLRIAAGLRQIDLAERIGVTKNAASDWERGDSMPWSRDMPNIARALRVSIDYLLTGRETPKLAALHRAIRVGASREQMLALIGADADA